MLQQMRNYTKGFASYLLVIPLVISFAAWGINDVFKASVPDTVAKIGGTSISKEEFDRQYRLQIRELGVELRQPVTPEMARSMNVGSNLLDNLIARTALTNLAAAMGIAVSDAEIRREIRADKAFAGPLGNFDSQKFERQINEMGMTEDSFLEQERSAKAVQQLAVPAQAAFEIPTGYSGALLASAGEERAVDYVVVSPSALPKIEPPSDAVLAAYVKAHPDRFNTPEYRDVNIAYISPEDVMNQVTVTADQIKQQYDANASTYNIPEKRDVEQLIFASESDAKAARAKIDSGQTFEQVATGLGKKASDISLGTVAQADLPDARGPAAFALPSNGVSAPVKGPFGWVLLHVTAVTPGKSTSLEQATPDIRKSLLAQLAGAKIADIMNAAQDAASTGAEVQEIAQKSGMHFVHVSAMDAQGLAPDGQPSAAPNNDDLRHGVFNAEVGDIGDPFQSKDGSAFVVKVNGITPPKLKPLDAVRAQAVAQWTADQMTAQLRQKAQNLAQQASAARDLSAVASVTGGKIEKSPALTRSSSSDTFSSTLLDAIFDASFGGVVSGPLGKGQGYVIARVTGVRHAPATPGSREFEMARSQIAGQVAGSVVRAMAEDAKNRQGVTTHPDLVQSVTGASS